MQALNFTEQEIKDIHKIYGSLNKENQRKLLQMNGLSRTAYYKYVKKFNLNKDLNDVFHLYGMSFIEFVNYLNTEYNGRTCHCQIKVEENGIEKEWSGIVDALMYKIINKLVLNEGIVKFSFLNVTFEFEE